MNGSTITAYPYLTRKPVTNQRGEASRLIRLLNLMIKYGAETSEKDSNGVTIRDYIKDLGLAAGWNPFVHTRDHCPETALKNQV